MSNVIKGIDISEHNGIIDFKKVKNDNIKFCILRQGYKQTIDKQFLKYVKDLQQNNIDIHGVYHFCYSTNTTQVLNQAKKCIENIKKAKLDKNIIVFFDFEYDTVDSAKKKNIILTKNDCIAFTQTFCDYIRKQGYKTGIYTNPDYYYKMYNPETIYKYDALWLAQHNNGKTPSLKCNYHQYSCTGKVNGINTNVDMDYYFEKKEVKSSMDFSKYYGMISNSGSDERGKASGGQAGDQTYREWQIKSWYNSPWNCVLRYPDQNVGNLIAELGIEAANNNLIGYNQSKRYTYWDHLKASNYRPSQITIACDADCSAGIIANTRAVGYLLEIPALQNITATYTGNMRSSFKKAGFQVLTASKYLNSYDYLLPGDILLNDVHHTATNLGIGKYATYTSSVSTSTKTTLIGKNITSTKTSQIQSMLNKVGLYGLSIDNDFGPATTKAVIDFQKKNNLEADGIVGTQTLNKLKELTTTTKETKGYNKTSKRIGIVTADALYVRSGPGINYSTLKSIPIIYKNNKVDICDEVSTSNGKWYYIKINNSIYGFCSANYIK